MTYIYFRSHVTEHLAVIGAHSGVRVTKRSMDMSQTLTSLAMECDGSDHITLGSSTGGYHCFESTAIGLITLVRSEDYPYE